ncbi:uncharacterized protein LOC120350717 [Nilaparvata lugens]|uniref:uncharacterized protein LOC120350717 n=1 Tax=Nilaparvata lugens TaxID=108931 RepID=UPI00193CC7F7|nr:uncharacterized protein LOC120350717 [Nilaparvata lugens]
MTGKCLNLIWVRPDGVQIMFCMVDAQFHVSQLMTWVGDMWLAEDSVSGERMLIDGKSIYVVSLPQPQHPLLITAPLLPRSISSPAWHYTALSTSQEPQSS